MTKPEFNDANSMQASIMIVLIPFQFVAFLTEGDFVTTRSGFAVFTSLTIMEKITATIPGKIEKMMMNCSWTAWLKMEIVRIAINNASKGPAIAPSVSIAV